MLKIKDLSVSTTDKKILKNINLDIKKGEIILLEGKNGSGKSTLLSTIMGDFKYSIDSGTIEYKNKKINQQDVSERAKSGIFLAHQHPIAIEGLNLLVYLKSIYESKFDKKIPVFKFRKLVYDLCDQIDYPKELLERDFNFNFSGGEKKKTEFLQLLLLKPELIMVDEIDSGVDKETVKIIFKTLCEYVQNNECSVIIVSHYDYVEQFFEDFTKYRMENGELRLF